MDSKAGPRSTHLDQEETTVIYNFENTDKLR